MVAALDDLANRGYTYVFSLSANQVAYFGFLIRGWRSAGTLGAVHWPAEQEILKRARSVARKLPLLPAIYRRLRRTVRRLSSLASTKRRHPFDALDRNGAWRRRRASTHVSIEPGPRPEAMAELVERIGVDGRIRHTRDRGYFGWRFQNPLSLYRFLFWEDARLEGYLVLQSPVRAVDRAWVNIVDWEATDSQVRADLLQAAIGWGGFGDLVIWSATLPHEAKQTLRDFGFSKMDKGRSRRGGVCRPTLLVRPVRQAIPRADWVLAGLQLLDLANWDARGIYSDGP